MNFLNWGKPVILENGRPIFVVSKPGYTKAHACLAVSYGGMHRCFENGTRQETVAGVAHFLEHKMFEMPDGNALQQFSAAGASVNAFTAADMTAYYFTCTDRFPEHLRMLLRFVSTPYFTAESVHKEQGIIAQEIGMDDDDPDWQVYQNLLRGLYHCHPVRESILGTVESIAQITPDTLYTCHVSDYREDPDPGKDLKAMVCAGCEERRIDNVLFLRQEAGVGQHDRKSNGQAEEYLTVSSYPDIRLRDRTPIRCKHVRNTVHSARQRQTADDDNDNTDRQDRHTDLTGKVDALIDTPVHNPGDDNPHDGKRYNQIEI